MKDNAKRSYLQDPITAVFEGWSMFLNRKLLHFIIKGLYVTEDDNSYNAFEKDIAVVHFFFQVPYSKQVLKIELSYFRSPLYFSTRGLSGWLCLTSSLRWVACLVSSLGSVSSLELRLSTGLLSSWVWGCAARKQLENRQNKESVKLRPYFQNTCWDGPYAIWSRLC